MAGFVTIVSFIAPEIGVRGVVFSMFNAYVDWDRTLVV